MVPLRSCRPGAAHKRILSRNRLENTIVVKIVAHVLVAVVRYVDPGIVAQKNTNTLVCSVVAHDMKSGVTIHVLLVDKVDNSLHWLHCLGNLGQQDLGVVPRRRQVIDRVGRKPNVVQNGAPALVCIQQRVSQEI
ncbi:hypothetical protein OGAPHI_000084 [Ogataea philodendri]|uniref:Uncharacterized protein n=1 Tax=Ogataea philodendri TaxID=1378263 RepID=A0A9P8TA01_9ASCO|nr:uncharacterized protein OGAPHI_000084 [Ogataea philodendri]KAH3671898.1 hypothetical protein OGAPHI_000084 [Ogataea philodendri]